MLINSRSEALDPETCEVRTIGLGKRFRSTDAVTDLNLEVPAGSFYVLMGPNGSGKTTTFRMLLGIVRPTSGAAFIRGIRCDATARARRCVGFVPELRDFGYSWMRVRDLIGHHSRYYPTWDATYEKRLINLLDIRQRERYGDLSKGEARRVQLLMALCPRPRVLLLDEPTDGLDVVAREVVLGVIAEHLTESPTTMVVATHLVFELESLADHVGVMRNGTLVTQGDRATLRQRLLHYDIQTPDNEFTARPHLTVLAKKPLSPRAARWTIWGDQDYVQTQLTMAGVAITHVRPLTLSEVAGVMLQEQGVR